MRYLRRRARYGHAPGGDRRGARAAGRRGRGETAPVARGAAGAAVRRPRRGVGQRFRRATALIGRLLRTINCSNPPGTGPRTAIVGAGFDSDIGGDVPDWDNTESRESGEDAAWRELVARFEEPVATTEPAPWPERENVPGPQLPRGPGGTGGVSGGSVSGGSVSGGSGGRGR